MILTNNKNMELMKFFVESRVALKFHWNFTLKYYSQKNEILFSKLRMLHIGLIAGCALCNTGEISPIASFVGLNIQLSDSKKMFLQIITCTN